MVSLPGDGSATSDDRCGSSSPKTMVDYPPASTGNEEAMAAAAITQKLQDRANEIRATVAALRPSSMASTNFASFVASIQSSMASIQSTLGAEMSSGVVGEFIFFPKLPTEVRLKIWKNFMCEPRIVELRHDYCVRYHQAPINNNNGWGDSNIPRWITDGGSWESKVNESRTQTVICYHDEIIRSNAPPPTVLHVNQESRRAALETYMKLGATHLTQCFAFFDPSRDILYLPARSQYDKLAQEDLLLGRVYSKEMCRTMEYMAVDLSVWSNRDCITSCSHNFPALETVNFIVHGTTKSEFHDNWIRPSEIEFVSLELEDGSYLERIAAEALQAAKDEFEEWKTHTIGFEERIVRFELKDMTRAGKKCCVKR